MWCPNCGANVRSGPVCERCGAPLPSEERQAKVRVEGARQRAARRAAEREQTSQQGGAQKGGVKRRGGTLGDFFNAQAERQATRDRMPAAPASPPPNQKVRRSWLPIRTRLSSGPVRGNTAKRGAQPPVTPQFPQYPARSEAPFVPQPQQHEPMHDGYRQQAYSQQQAYDQPPPPQRPKGYGQAQRIEEYPQPQNYAQEYDQVQPPYGEYDAHDERAPYDQRYDHVEQESQADIDDAWEVGYRAALGPGEEKGRNRRGRKEKPRRGDAGVSVTYGKPDPRAMREPDDDELRSPSRSWNIVGVPSASQHISGPLSSSRHYVPMVPLEEMAAMQVSQGNPRDRRPYPAARHSPQRIIGGMSRLTFNLLLLGLVLCILAVPACIGLRRLDALTPGAMATTSAQKTVVPTPALAQGFSGFLNDDFSIAYPSNWQRTPLSGSSHTISFTDGKDTSAKVAATNAIPATELQQHLDEIAHGFNGVVPQVIASGQRKTYNKAVWLENDYIITVVRGDKAIQIELRVLAIDYGASTYDILLSVPRTDFSQTNSRYFEPMLNSFRFQ